MDLASAVGIPGGGSVAAVARPVFQISLGTGGLAGSASAPLGGAAADPWRETTTSIRVVSGLAPQVDTAEIFLAAGDNTPQVAVGDSGSLALGYGDGQPQVVFGGSVEAVQKSVDGRMRILVTDGGAALSRFRPMLSYDRQNAGDIVRDLAGRAGVQVDTIDDGVALAFYAADDTYSAWEQIAALARKSGCRASITPAGKLKFEAMSMGTVVRTFTYAQDILACDVTGHAPLFGELTMVGEGAAGTQGQDAWCWLVKDPSQVIFRSGSGDPTVTRIDASLRSAQAVQDAARSARDAGSLSGTSGRLVVPGAPDVFAGATIEIAGTPDGAQDGVFLAVCVSHRFSKSKGFVTEIEVRRGDGAAGLPEGSL